VNGRKATVEFFCEGCGVEVFGFGRDTVPESYQCATCEWLCEHVRDPHAFWTLYRSFTIGADK
jgi:hypothetical protein